MLADFEEQVKQYNDRREINPNYIIINPEDEESLVHEMQLRKMLPTNRVPGKLQYQGIRIIQSTDMPKSFFDVAGN